MGCGILFLDTFIFLFKSVPDSDDDDEFPEDDKDSKVPTQRSFQPKRNSVSIISSAVRGVFKF